MGPSASNRSRTRSRSASNVSILNTVSRNLQARIAARPRERLLPMRAKTSKACPPFEATGPRICAHVAPVLCQGLLADALTAAASSEDRCKGGCSLGHPFDPVSIPHDIENRRVATRVNQERNPQVSGDFHRSPQVTESARLNLSRWRHGFEPRWDYQEGRRSGHLSGVGGAGPVRSRPAFVPQRTAPRHGLARPELVAEVVFADLRPVRATAMRRNRPPFRARAAVHLGWRC